MRAQDYHLAKEDLYMDFLDVVLWRHMVPYLFCELCFLGLRFQGQGLTKHIQPV